MQTADEFKKTLEDVRKTLLLGTNQEDHPLSILGGNQYVLEDLFKTVEKPLYDRFYLLHINRRDRAFVTWPRPIFQPRPSRPILTREIVFPTPSDLNINMMPIRLGSGVFNSLPDNCKQYKRFIWDYCNAKYWFYDENSMPTPRAVIGYLTIQEGLVPVGQAQRRPGLHIERPAGIKSGGLWHEANSKEYQNIAWGLGAWGEDGLPEGGIFMASTVANSCAIWDVLINKPEEVTDKHGGLENMRHLLGTPRKLDANEMCWFTDRTPHESLPIEPPTDDPTATHVYRQFFRLVVGPISAWYSKHNTPNPLGIEPDAPISDDDKFA